MMTDLPGRLAAMDAMGVDVQVLSPSPGQYYYWADPDLADRIVALQNDHIAATVARHPDRLAGLAAVSLQHPGLAAAQLDHAVRTLRLRGAEISTTVGGRELGDPAFDIFWAKAAELAVPVFLHPLGSSLGTRLDRSYLANIIGQPIEKTIALSHLVFAGVLDRHPRLKILAAHGGGYLPTYPARSDHAWHVRPASATMEHPLSAYLNRIWFDDLERFPTILHHRHRPTGDPCGAGRFRPGAALLVGYDAKASRPPRAPSAKLRTGLPRTEIDSVSVTQHDRKPLVL